MSSTISPIVMIALLVLVVGGVWIFARRRTPRRSVIAEPTCGGCGYCVRGLETMICPECGGDLREVGILAPGTAKPLTPAMRLLLWTLVAPAPAFIVAGILADWVAPWNAVTTRQRVIFVQSLQVNATIRVEQQASEMVLGRGFNRPPPPMQTMRLLLDSKNSTNVLEVDLRDDSYRLADAAGNVIARKGPFDAAAVEDWLTAHGFADPSLTKRADDVFAAVQEMKTPQGGKFSRFSPNPERGNLHDVTAHPASPGFTSLTPQFGSFFRLGMVALIYLLGLPFVLRRRNPTIPSDADQARTNS